MRTAAVKTLLKKNELAFFKTLSRLSTEVNALFP